MLLANEESHSVNEILYLNGNTSSRTSASSAGESFPENYHILTAYTLLVSIGFVLNLLVIYVVLVRLVNERKRSHSGNFAHLLVAHLSAVSICLASVTPFNTSDQTYFIPVAGIHCSWVVYLKSVFLCSFSINVVLITFERLQAFSGAQRQNRLWAVYMLAFMWIFSLIFNIPTTQMTKAREKHQSQNNNNHHYNANHSTGTSSEEQEGEFTGNCVLMNLYNSPVVTVIYESGRFALFHAAVVVYMVYALVKVRSCLKYLYHNSPSPNESTIRKLRSVRLICFHFLTFILVWLPAGLLVFIRRVLNRVDNDSIVKGISGYIASAVPVYVLINPLISLLLLESNWTRLVCWGKAAQACQAGQDGEMSERCLNGNTSRFSTAAFTSEETRKEKESIPLNLHSIEQEKQQEASSLENK